MIQGQNSGTAAPQGPTGRLCCPGRGEESQDLRGWGRRACIVIMNIDAVISECVVFINICLLHVVSLYPLTVTQKCNVEPAFESKI